MLTLLRAVGWLRKQDGGIVAEHSSAETSRIVKVEACKRLDGRCFQLPSAAIRVQDLVTVHACDLLEIHANADSIKLHTPYLIDTLVDELITIRYVPVCCFVKLHA